MLVQPRYKLTEVEGSSAKVGIVSRITPLSIDEAINAAREALVNQQQRDGHWVYELEADCTIPAEYILLNHFTGEVNDKLEQKIATYLREHQADYGGWPLFEGGDLDLSCSVKAYFALKMVGDDPASEHMSQSFVPVYC